MFPAHCFDKAQTCIVFLKLLCSPQAFSEQTKTDLFLEDSKG